MTVLILGASGFLGSRILNHFDRQGRTVKTLSFRPEHAAYVLADVEQILCEHQPLAVINAGACQLGTDDPEVLEELIVSNVFLPSALASLILKHAPGTVLITFGTSWQIGDGGEPSPFNAYAASKTAAEAFLSHFALSGLRTATLRLYDTYGPNDPRHKIVNLIADALINKHDLPMSPGHQVIDLVHIDDVLSAVDTTLDLLTAAEKGIHHVFAVRSGKATTIEDLVDQLKRAAGIEDASYIRLGARPYRDPKRERFSLFADTPTPPGWAPQIDLIDGLSQVLAASRATTRASTVMASPPES